MGLAAEAGLPALFSSLRRLNPTSPLLDDARARAHTPHTHTANAHTRSIWTIDLAHLLARLAGARARVRLVTAVAGADEAHAADAFYAADFASDAPRVRALFAEAGSRGVRVEVRRAALEELAALVRGGGDNNSADGDGCGEDGGGDGSGGGGGVQQQEQQRHGRRRRRRRRCVIVLVDKRITDPEGAALMYEAQRRAAAAAQAAAAATETAAGAGDGDGGGGLGAPAGPKRCSSPGASSPPGKRQQTTPAAAAAAATAAAAPAGAAEQAAARQQQQEQPARPRGRAAVPGAFMGHYLLLAAHSARRRAFLACDPDPARPARVWLPERALEAGRRAQGTDEDILIVDAVEQQEEEEEGLQGGMK